MHMALYKTYELWSILRFKNIKYKSAMPFLRYSIIAWGLPLVVCLTVDLLTKGIVTSFGNHGHCWIVPFRARLAVYIVPFSVLSYGNFLVIFIAILQTKHEKRKSHSMLPKSDQLNLSKMMIKLRIAVWHSGT